MSALRLKADLTGPPHVGRDVRTFAPHGSFVSAAAPEWDRDRAAGRRVGANGERQNLAFFVKLAVLSRDDIAVPVQRF